jgi:DNA (cytosine-5)-methyltransferase 1
MAPKQKPGRSKQDYGTPPSFLEAVKRRLGIDTFAIDLAASKHNAVDFAFYDERQNALARDWPVGGWCWLNPPFGQLEPWVRHTFEQSRRGARVAMLVPAGVGSNWWRDHVHGKAFVLLLNGRITFVGETAPYPKDCVLLLYGPDVAPGYDVWQWAKASGSKKSAA